MSDKEQEPVGDGQEEKSSQMLDENPEVIENAMDESTSEAIQPSTSGEGPLPLSEESTRSQNIPEPATEPAQSGCSLPLVGDAVVMHPYLNHGGLHSGKLDVFQKFFERPIDFFTRPDRRTRHNARRHRNLSDPRSDRFSNENPLGHLQTLEPEPERDYLLNQAGAIVGIRSRSPRPIFASGDAGPLAGFGSVAEAEHSLGSAETVPIGEIYSGNFSPPRPCSEASSRGVSCDSFASFPSSRPQTSSDIYDIQISSSQSSDSNGDTRLISTDSTNSERLPEVKRPTRRRRNACRSVPIITIRRNDSALAGSEGSDSSEVPSQRPASMPSEARDSNAEGNAYEKPYEARDSNAEGNVYEKPSDVVSTEPESSSHSEDEAVKYPELDHPVDSDDCQPLPDIGKHIASHSQQGLNGANACRSVPITTLQSDSALAGSEGSDSSEGPIKRQRPASMPSDARNSNAERNAREADVVSTEPASSHSEDDVVNIACRNVPIIAIQSDSALADSEGSDTSAVAIKRQRPASMPSDARNSNAKGNAREEPSDVSTEPASSHSEDEVVNIACRNVPIITIQSDSALADSEGSDSSEVPTKRQRLASMPSDARNSNAKGNAREEPSDVDSTEPESSSHSENEAVNYPELDHPVDSDDTQPLPDIGKDIASHSQKGLDCSGVSTGISPALPESGNVHQQLPESTEQSDGEPDPSAVASCSSIGSKSLEQHKSDKDGN